jgi:hypothetical protein
MSDHYVKTDAHQLSNSVRDGDRLDSALAATVGLG